MTVEEAIEAANQGDIDAMMSLGAYYMSAEEIQGEINGKGVREIGVEWYEKAAKAGYVAAIVPLCAFKTVLMMLNSDDIASEKTISEWKEIYDWMLYGCELLKANALGSESVDINSYMQDLDYTRYHLALSHFYAKNHETSLELVKESDDIKSKILKALATYMIGQEKADDDLILDGFDQMRIIEGNYEYADAEKEQFEELVYAVAARTLATFYRIILEDIDSALRVLQFVRTYLKTDNSINAVDEEIRHFRKKLFGGYEYIEN